METSASFEARSAPLPYPTSISVNGAYIEEDRHFKAGFRSDRVLPPRRPSVTSVAKALTLLLRRGELASTLPCLWNDSANPVSAWTRGSTKLRLETGVYPDVSA